ncbi:CBS domain-containing protein [Bacteriovoracaceae bacterium]|nr:CBS domain-containing protein [Bacteriovoracaceae bacterium]|tara:strand:+ start:50387 stop:50809 length:423 start_codon:yes stop_codon:yes gene_type:complete
MKKSCEEKLNEILNIQVEEYSTPCSITASKSSTIDEVSALMKDNGVRHVPVVEDGTVLGIISERDITNIPKETNILASDLMSTSVYSVESHTLLKDVVFEMSSKKIGSAIIIDQSDKSFSIFTSVDALNALNEILGGGNF